MSLLRILFAFSLKMFQYLIEPTFNRYPILTKVIHVSFFHMFLFCIRINMYIFNGFVRYTFFRMNKKGLTLHKQCKSPIRKAKLLLNICLEHIMQDVWSPAEPCCVINLKIQNESYTCFNCSNGA